MKSMVDIYQKKMEVLQKGKTGMPILIITGMACSFDEWHHITDALSATHQIIMFHRPGLGESEIGTEKRSTAQVCKEITCLLDRFELTEPFLLIGHSYGGLIAQHYAKLNPQQVKALILVDSTSHDLKKLDELDLPILNTNASDEDWVNTCKTYAEKSEKELQSLLQTKLSDSQKSLPESIQQSLIDFQHKPNLYKAMAAEVANWKEDALEIKELGHIGKTPLLVIGRDKKAMIKLGIMDGLPEEELIILEGVWEKINKRSDSTFF